MAELTKLRPDRDLQCYFQQPSAIAALSGATETGFRVSGCWRQQFDWAVVEWNRDNVIEHPALRKLPDGNLSGLHLSYEEVRTNCEPSDSKTFDAIGWSALRIWEISGGLEHIHFVPLLNYATPIEGEYVQATAVFELQGTPTPGDYIELAWLDKHANALVGLSLAGAVAELAGFINALEGGGVTAVADGTTITLTYTGALGANGNRIGVYGSVAGASTESWSPAFVMFSGGESPTRWRIDLDFSDLTDSDEGTVPMTNVRKMRWTWAAPLQWQEYERSEFTVSITDWEVTGAGKDLYVAGPGSRRIEDNSPSMAYTGAWNEERGNYSGGSIHRTQRTGNTLQCIYSAGAHTLYLGTRRLNTGGAITVQVDGGTPISIGLQQAAEDYLVRVPIGDLGGGTHTFLITHSGADWTDVFIDFLEIAVATTTLPTFIDHPNTTLATDWDTDHSLSIAAERTAWLIKTLGFTGRANHYVGALKFYELVCAGNVYAEATIEFTGTPEFGGTTSVTIAGTPLSKLNYITDTAETIAKAFELLITAGSSAVWAHADGAVLTIVARQLGTTGNAITISAATGSGTFTTTVSGSTLAGGVNGTWLTDLAADTKINLATRDWSRKFYEALDSYGIAVAAAFSMELGHGDDSLEAGIAARYPDEPVWLNTPSLHTNFGPQSTLYWKHVYREMAGIMVAAGVTPFLQFGEVQWWYFPNAAGMPFYDAYTTSTFEAAYGHALAVIEDQHADPADYPDEAEFLPSLIGAFTNTAMAFVRATYAAAVFEVLYPPDVNDFPFTRVVNYPAADWTDEILACLKTENFTYTGNRDLNKAMESIKLPAVKGFLPAQSSHLVGIGEYTTPWLTEHSLSITEGVESVVLFALDQFCLIGYETPLKAGARRAIKMGVDG